MDAESFLAQLSIAHRIIETLGKRLTRKDKAARRVIERKERENARLRAALAAYMREDE